MGSTFNTLTLSLIPIAIVINIVMGQIVSTLRIPLYLDSIGTVLVGVLAGPLAGGLTGLLSNVIWGLVTGNTVNIWFAPVAVVIGILAGIFGARSWFRKWTLVILGGLITGVVAALLSAPIATYVFGGVTGSGTDVLVVAFRNLTDSLLGANFAQGVMSDPLDKAISFLVVFLVIKGLSRRLLVRFPQGEKSAEPRRRPLIGRVN
jgi:energy-coupling factor transport system substrate-specific component